MILQHRHSVASQSCDFTCKNAGAHTVHRIHLLVQCCFMQHCHHLLKSASLQSRRLALLQPMACEGSQHAPLSHCVDQNRQMTTVQVNPVVVQDLPDLDKKTRASALDTINLLHLVDIIRIQGLAVAQFHDLVQFLQRRLHLSIDHLAPFGSRNSTRLWNFSKYIQHDAITVLLVCSVLKHAHNGPVRTQHHSIGFTPPFVHFVPCQIPVWKNPVVVDRVGRQSF